MSSFQLGSSSSSQSASAYGIHHRYSRCRNGSACYLSSYECETGNLSYAYS